MKKITRRCLSTFLAVLLVLQCFMMDPSTITASASSTNELSNWSIRLEFLDEETGNLVTDYDIVQDEVIYQNREVIMQVSIKYTGDGSVTYAPEDVSFTLADIRDMVAVDLYSSYEYDIAAELKGSDTGRGDWYYEVDSPGIYTAGENLYTFTNKESITGAFTSTFQINMEPYPLSSIPDFEKDFSTELTFNNIEGSVASNTASFSYTATKSTYEISASYVEIEDGISDEIIGRLADGTTTDDYIFAHVQVEAPYVTEKIGKIYQAEMIAEFPDDVVIGNHSTADIFYSGIFTNPEFSTDENNTLRIYAEGYDNYLFPEDPGVVCLGFYVAFPRDKYVALGSYNVPITLNGAYFAEETLSTLDTFSLNFNFSEFNYVWEAGKLYLHEKNAYNTTNPDIYRDNLEDNYIYENMVYAYDHHDKALYQDYVITMTAIYTGKPYDIVLGDDLSYYIYEDNTYRKVEDDERFATEIYIPSNTGASAVEIYGRKPGSDIYELYGTYSGTSSSSKTVKPEVEYCDIQIKFVGLTDSIQARKVWIDYAYVLDTENDNGKIPIKVYNFSYMDIVIDDTPVTFDRESVTTNITGLDAEIDAFDKETYGYIKYRSTDYKTILRSVAGVHQSRGALSSDNGDTVITDDRISILYGEVVDFYDFQGGGNTWCDFSDSYIIPANWTVNIDEIGFYSYNTYNYFYFANGDTVLNKGSFVLHKDLPEELKSQITITETPLEDGTTEILIHYDFTDNPLITQSELFTFFLPQLTFHIDRDTFEMYDLSGRRVDFYVTRSINQASNTTIFEYTERTARESIYCPTLAYSTYQGVSSESSVNGDVFNNSEKIMEPGGVYEYKLMLHTGNSKAKYVTFFDSLDGAYGSNVHWQGTLLDVDISDMEALGATPKVYYSTNASQAHDLSASGWTLSTSYSGSLSKIKAVAIDLGEYEIPDNSLALVKIKMQAPSSLASYAGAAYNNCSVDYKSYDASLTTLTESNASETIMGLISNTTKISLESPYINVHITYDGNSGKGTSFTDTITSKDVYTIKENPFTKEGYTFEGWDMDPDVEPSDAGFAENEKISDVMTAFDITNDTTDAYVTLYAIWEPITYTIIYDGNGSTSGTTESSSHIFDEAKALTENGYEKIGHTFKDWNTEPDGSGTSYDDLEIVKNLTTTDEDEITLYAQWTVNEYDITYVLEDDETNDPNNPDSYTYGVGVDEFYEPEKPGHEFVGWYEDEDCTIPITSIDEDRTGEVILYPKWESPPEITVTPADDPDNKDVPGTTDPAKGSVLEFYEGETVTKEMLLENVMAHDKEDGNLTDNIRIIKITYSEGKVVGESKLPSYTEEWPDDMSDDALLDTWFMQLDEEDSPVSHTITYAVTDSAGNETTFDWIVKVKYNEAPEIQAEDRYFTLEEAQNGMITEELLLSEITASDLEDDALYGKGCLNDNVKILSFNSEEFKYFEGSGYVVLTLYVHDSMGPEGTCDCVNGEISHPIGKETMKQIVVYIVDGDGNVDGPNVKYIRFIDEHYYDLNKDKYKENLSTEEKAALHKNGGLHVNSLWYVEDSYRALIEGAFAKTTALFTYTFDETDVDSLFDSITAFEENNGHLPSPDAVLTSLTSN